MGSERKANRRAVRGVKRTPRKRNGTESLQRIIALASGFYWRQDKHYRFVQIEAPTPELTRSRSRQLLGKTRWEQGGRPLSEGGWEAHRATLEARQPFANFTYEVKTLQGEVGVMSTNGEPVYDARGRFAGYHGIARDITQEHRAAQALRESEERFRSLTELSSDWYWEKDLERRFTRFESYGRQANQRYLGKTDQELQMNFECGWDKYNAAFDSMKPFRDLVMSTTVRGETYYAAISGTPRFDAHGIHIGYRGISRNITDRKRAEAQVQYLATHDGLTALPNRVMFSQLLTLAIESSKRYERKFAVLFIDLDRFKLINDTLGHEAGDTLLKEMSVRLKDCLRASDVVARLGGDEFVVLVQEVSDVAQVTAIARKILAAVIRPMTILAHECRVTASIGVALYPGDAEDEQSLMKNADMAMYLAKEEGKNNFQFFSREIKTQSLERLTLETNLRQALERGEFTLHYQAKVDLKADSITGVEALIRWQSPVLGQVSPMQFIPLAEETGLIVPIGRWVLRTACAQNVAWQRQGLPPVCIAVNLSTRQFADESLLNDIRTALEETGMKPELLELEITEGMVLQNVDRAVKLLTAIKAMGVRLAIDDFGTGYSSLAQIKRFPIDTLKVDRSFIRDVAHQSEDRAITEAIIAMGKTLSLTVVAEGVETEEQETFLRERACDEMQGYYFSKPIAPEQFAELLRKHRPGGTGQRGETAAAARNQSAQASGP